MCLLESTYFVNIKSRGQEHEGLSSLLRILFKESTLKYHHHSLIILDRTLFADYAFVAIDQIMLFMNMFSY